MKLLVTTNGIWYSGAQISTNEFLSFLTNLKSVEVKMVSCLGGKFIPSLANVEIHRVPCWSSGALLHMKTDSVFEQLIRWADVVWIATGEFAVAKEIKRIKKLPVVAHLHSYEPICPIIWFSYGFNGVCGKECSPWLLIRCKQETNIELAKIGLLNRFRAEAYWLLDFGKGPLDYYGWRRVMDSAVNSIDFFIAVSRATRDIIVSHLPEVRDKIEVVYNPVAHRPWRYASSFPDESSDYVLYASGANPLKGPHILLNALKILLNEGIDMKLYMTGTSNSWLEGLARRLGVEGQVKFLSKLPDTEYFSMMAKAKALALPSIWPEPLPSVAIESISLGVPVVGSNRGGIPEIVGNYGITTNPTPEEVAKAVSTTIEQRFDKHEMRRYAMQKFGEGNVERFLQILSSVK